MKWLKIVLVSLILTGSVEAKITINGQEVKEPNDYCAIVKFLTVPPEKQNDPDFINCVNDPAKTKALEDPIRREIFDKFVASTENTAFVNLEAAQKNFSMRLLIVDKMSKMNAGLIDYGYCDPNKKPPIPVSVESNKWRKGTRIDWVFHAKNGEASFAAIGDLLAKKTRGECSGAIGACVLGAAAEVNQQVTFDGIHANGSLEVSWSVPVGKHFYNAADKPTHVPGDLVYLKNKDDYVEKCKANKVNGFFQGENFVYIGGGKYSGLGMDQMTEAEARDDLKKAYENDTGKNFVGNANVLIRFTAVRRPLVKP